MKLLIVADTFFPSLSSAAIQLNALALEMSRLGHKVTVITPNSKLKNLWDIEDYEGIKIVRFYSFRTKDTTYVRRLIGEFCMPHLIKLLLNFSPVNRCKWDGIIWYSPSIFFGPLIKFLKQKNNCSTYLILRDIFPEWAFDVGLIKNKFLFDFFKSIANFQYHQADVIGVQTKGNLHYFKKWELSHSSRNLEVLNNWLSSCEKKESEPNKRLPRNGKKIFIYAGNMGIAQDGEILIKLAIKLQYRKDIGFLFVGKGSEFSKMKTNITSSNQSNIVFLDEVNQEKLSEIYKTCHAGLVSLNYKHRSHNIPGKFIDYLKNGLPTLAFVNKGNDLVDVIETNKVGFAVDNGSINNLAQKCEELANNIERGVNYNFNCQKLFKEKYSVEKICLQITNSLIKSNRKIQF